MTHEPTVEDDVIEVTTALRNLLAAFDPRVAHPEISEALLIILGDHLSLELDPQAALADYREALGVHLKIAMEEEDDHDD